MPERHVYYAKNRFLYPGLIWVLSLMLVVTSTGQTWIPALSWALFLSYLAYLIFVNPSVVLESDGITLKNPFVTKSFGWQKVELVDVRWALFVQVAGKRHESWAALAPSRYHSRRVARGDLTGIGLASAKDVRSVEAPQSETGAIIFLAKRYLESPSGNHISRKVDWPALAITLLLLVAAIALS